MMKMTKKQVKTAKKAMAMTGKKFYGGDFDREYTSIVSGPLFRSPIIQESQFISSNIVNPDGLSCFKFAALKGIEIDFTKKEVK